MTTRLTLYVYPDGRRLIKSDGDISEAMRNSISDGVALWEPGGTLVVNGAEVDVVNVQPSVEDRLTAIEERLGMRPVTVR